MIDPWCQEDPRQALVWLRPDPRKRLFAPWLIGVSLLILGALLCALFFAQVFKQFELLFLLGGLLCILSGMLTMVIHALKVLQDEKCLALLPIGILYKKSCGYTHKIPWHTIDQIHLSADSKQTQILYQTHHGQESAQIDTRWMGIEDTMLCEVLKGEYRKVLMGIPLASAKVFHNLKINTARPIR